MRNLFVLVILLVGVGAMAADGPLEAATKLDDGVLVFSYPARDGVCGNDHGLRLRMGDDEGEAWYMKGCWVDGDQTWQGDVVATCRVSEGQVRKLDFTVAKEGDTRPRADRDLGAISAKVAVDFCFELARITSGDLAEDALLGAVVARSIEIAKPMVALARDRDRPEDLREQAVFWLAVLAGDQAVDSLQGMINDEAEDLDLRVHAVFALTQLDDDRGFPLLMDVAREHPHPEIRRSAFIWLAQYDNPEVVNLFEEILVGN